VGSNFTWSKKQRNHVMSNMDRFLVSRDWEQRYPKVYVKSLTIVGSDHSPILLDDGMDSPQRRRIFIFEKVWLSNADVKKRITEKWPARGVEGVQEYWKRMKKDLRQLSKGMGANLDSQMKRRKKELLGRIEELDNKAEIHGLSEEEWKGRYNLEGGT
jgi:hypothetical protein